MYLILYPTCIVVKGARRSTICDLERLDYHYIPNDLADLIEHLRIVKYDDFLLTLSTDDSSTVAEYKDFLLENDLCFFCDHPELYPELDSSYHSFTDISNAILDRDADSSYDLKAAISALNELNCKHLQLRFYNSIKLDELDIILEQIQYTDILSVDIFFKSNAENKNRLKNFVNKWTKIKLFLIHSAPITEVVIMNEKSVYTNNMGNFIFTEEKILSAQNCGCISPAYFTVNTETFTESLNFNSCLHKKISIDAQGRIKNCPTLERSYGDFGVTYLKDALIDTDFLKYAGIKKDQINICKDCEHRHFCTDCRAFVTDVLDKPKKCNYDPYTAKWIDSTTY